MPLAQLTSKIETVKVYSAGATVTRIAELPLTTGELPEQVEIAGLPLALDDSSVRVRVEVESGAPPLACDVRIGLAVPPPQEIPNPPADEELRAAAAEVQQIDNLIALIDNEISVLRHLHVPDRPDGEPGKAPPPSPMSARLALANFSDEQIRARLQEKRENLEKLRKAEEHLAELEQKQHQASTAKDAKPHELRKTVIVRLSYEGESPAEVGAIATVATARLVVEYLVPGARWTPTYVCRLNSAESIASIAVRALICQRTGEDWTGVRLELSTAKPMAWCALPELPSLRLGRSQAVLRKSGWRRSPIGAELLFEDFDHQKQEAIAALPAPLVIPHFHFTEVPPLPHLSFSDQMETPMSEGSTATATKVLKLAEEEARRLGLGFVGTEQILLGLIAEGTGVAAKVLKSMGVELKDARIEVEKIIGRGSGSVPEEITFTPIAKRVSELSKVEAHQLGHNYIGTEHLLLGLLQEGEGYSATVLKNLGVDLTKARTQVIQMLGKTAGVTANSSQGRTKSPTLDEFDITLISPDMMDEEWDNAPTALSSIPPSAPRPESYRATAKSAPQTLMRETLFKRLPSQEANSLTDRLAYGVMRMGAADDPAKRGKLSIEQQQETYLEILKRQKVVVRFNVVSEVEKAVSNAQSCLSVALPPGGIDVRHVAGSFDYAYSADGRVDVPSDGQFHSVALTSKSTDVDLRYIVVPREDTNVFRIAQLRNPLQAPLLAGPADVYVNGEYILSTNITTVPPKGQMELGLGVEQAIKVARNTSYEEVRSGETIVAFNELRHNIKIDITNLLPRDAKIEVRERLPVPQQGAKVDVQINQVTPAWEKYKQQERSRTIRGGYRWQVEVPAKGQKALSVDYTIKTFVDSELIGGNRREG